MRPISRLAGIAVIALAPVGLALPAQAATADPAVTSCSFTGLYDTYSDGQLSGLRRYYTPNTALTVTGGDGGAWQVTINRNGQSGWMDADCVLFLA